MESPGELTSPNHSWSHHFKKFHFKGESSTPTLSKERFLPTPEDTEKEGKLEKEKAENEDRESEEPNWRFPEILPLQQSLPRHAQLKKSQSSLAVSNVSENKEEKGNPEKEKEEMEIDEPSSDCEEDKQKIVADGLRPDSQDDECHREMVIDEEKLEISEPLSHGVEGGKIGVAVGAVGEAISTSANCSPSDQPVKRQIVRPPPYSGEMISVPLMPTESPAVLPNAAQIGTVDQRLAGPAGSSGRLPSFGLSRNFPKKVEEVPPTEPRRTYQRILQLLRGEIEPEKCTTECGQCEVGSIIKSFQMASGKHVPCAQLKEAPANSSNLGSFGLATAAPAVPQREEARQKSVLSGSLRNDAVSKDSSLKTKRPYEADDQKDDPNQVLNQTKYRSSLYRSAASFTPSVPLPKKSQMRGQKIQVVAKKPTVFPFWRVMFANQSSRKNKIWEDDGTLAIEGNTFILRGSDGKEVGRATGVSASDILDLAEGKMTKAGPKEVMLLEGISKEDYHSGKYLD